MYRIREEDIIDTRIFGAENNKIIEQIENLIDFVCEEDKFDDVDLDFFGINGSVLLYGIPGVGKTSMVMKCINYALDKYGVEAYTFETSEIIVSELGKSTYNLHKELKAFSDLKEGILFIDELDSLCVNRNDNDELSELKRMLIDFMKFMDKFSSTSKKMIISCTNVIDQIDPALVRRFSITKEIYKPTLEEKREFMNICIEKCGFNSKKISNHVLSKYATIDDIKRQFRNEILNGSLEKFISSIVEE